MIHTLLSHLHETLPVSPPLLVGAAGLLVAILALVLYGRGRATILFSLGIILLAAGLVVGLIGLNRPGGFIEWGPVEDVAETLVGPAEARRWEQFTAAGIVLAAGLLYGAYNSVFAQKPGERARQQLAGDVEQAQALGSAHLCSARTFRRWHKSDPLGWMLSGEFWGARGTRLGTRFCLSGEDIARGVAVFGPQGSGKTQAVILPAIADRMRDGHSLIVADVQGELQPYVERIAATTGHVVIAHNPSHPAESCAINLCDWIDDVADARSMATVLLSDAHGQGDPFWARAAVNLLAGCALHYHDFCEVLDARQDLHAMAKTLSASQAPGAAQLAADFTASMRTDEPKLALNIMAEVFNVGLAPWAHPAVRGITDHTDVDLAAQLVGVPTVLVLSCDMQHIDAYGPYLGTILRVLTTRLDHLAREAKGVLPRPVGLILEEFPALGRLESLVRDINLVRKRRISILTAAQSLAQFDHVYPGKGEADRLLAGLATKIVFGGCDWRTAEFFSRLSGQMTLALASLSQSRQGGNGTNEGATASFRSRPLLLPDDLVEPQRGNCTVFAAYSQHERAAQAIFHARLTPFYRRKDWKLDQARAQAPLTLPRPGKDGNPAADAKVDVVSGWRRKGAGQE